MNTEGSWKLSSYLLLTERKEGNQDNQSQQTQPDDSLQTALHFYIKLTSLVTDVS